MKDQEAPATKADVDDATVGAFVREVAAGWVAPPQRLGAETWRDRVTGGSRTVRRGHAAWWRRLGAAAVGAVTATVGLALVAVWLTMPRGSAPAVGAASPSPVSSSGAASPFASAPAASGVAAAPSATTAPSDTPAPRVTPLPTNALYGPPLADRSIMVGVGSSFRLLDLGSGQYSAPVADRYAGQSEMWPLADGTYLCACMDRVTSLDRNGAILEGFNLSLKVFSATGATLGNLSLPGIETPRNPSAGPNDPPALEVTATLSPDSRWMYIGSGAWTKEGWHTRVDVVDVRAGRVIQSLPFADVPTADADSVVTRAIVAPDGDHVMALISSYNRLGGRVERALTSVASDGKLTYLGPLFSAGRLSDCDMPYEGFVNRTLYYALCQDATLHRFTLDGEPQPDLFIPHLSGMGLAATNGPRVDPTRGTLYLWDPFGHTLSVVDAVRGTVLGQVTAPAPTAGRRSGIDALLGSLGQWLAPSAAAKVYLAPAVQLSPDGSRLYALGVTGTGFEDAGGSAGVFVFDTATIALVGNWPAAADYFSMALNADGSVLYVAGQSETGADGRPSDQPASIVAYDTATGSVRQVLGALTGFVDLQLNDGQ